jgi:hypothetical protein
MFLFRISFGNSSQHNRMGPHKKAKTVNDLQFFEIFGLTLAPTETILLVDYAKLKP